MNPHMSSGVIDQDRKFMWHCRRSHCWPTSNTDGRLPSFERRFTVRRVVIGPAVLILGSMLHTDTCYSKEWMIPKEIYHRHNFIYIYIYIYIYMCVCVCVCVCPTFSGFSPARWSLQQNTVESQRSFPTAHSNSSSKSRICVKHMHSYNVLSQTDE